MKVYKTTPENITALFSYQNSKSEEGILLTSKDINVFLPNYTSKISDFLDVETDILNNLADLIDKIANGVLASNSGGAITTPTFVSDLTTIKTQLNNIKQTVSDIKDKL